MKKDFDKWNKRKQGLHTQGGRPFYHGREVWWCAVGVNIGNEVDGTGGHNDRPIVVIRPFNAETFFGVALIGHQKSGSYYFPMGEFEGREATANLSQARLYDTKRLLKKMGTLDEKLFNKLSLALAEVLFPNLFPETNLPRLRGARPKP